MNSNTELECCIAIYDFLIDDKPIATNFGDCKSMHNMSLLLNRQNTSMVKFTQDLNIKYRIYDALWQKDAREFFGTTKGRDFYKRIIRNLKLELCLKDQK